MFLTRSKAETFHKIARTLAETDLEGHPTLELVHKPDQLATERVVLWADEAHERHTFLDKFNTEENHDDEN